MLLIFLSFDVLIEHGSVVVLKFLTALGYFHVRYRIQYESQKGRTPSHLAVDRS